MVVLRRLLTLLVTLAFGFGVIAIAPAYAQDRHIEASLAFDTRMPKPGGSVTLAIGMKPESGWHGYWTNPGAAGLPVEADWDVPTGVTVSSLRHPAPHLLDVQGIASYVHDGPFTLLATMKVPHSLAQGTALPVEVALSWLVCSDTLCVPERATLSARLEIGSGAPDASGARIVAAAQRAMPKPLGGVTLTRDGEDWVFASPSVARGNYRLFPEQEGWFDAAAQQTVSRDGDGVSLRIPAAGPAPGNAFRGVLASGTKSYVVSASPVASSWAGAQTSTQSAVTSGAETLTQPEQEPSPKMVEPVGVTENGSTPPSPTKAVSGDVLRIALMGALLGGLLLNLMPCVFPILSLKALSLAKSGGDPRAARVEGAGYAAGVILTALLLGALLIGLRAIGMEIGWSFQLQSPGVILVLLVLTGAIALNLAGLFELPMPAFAARGSQTGGFLGAFSTGALAAFIAMPCSGPFMAGALGAALVLPAPLALAVFAMLGLGMALPFLAVAFVPAAQRRLPKPGAWMDTLRKVLSLPMFATALALAWLLGRQTGVNGMALGLAVLSLFAVSLWWYGLRQRRGFAGWMTLVPATLALAGVLAVGIPEVPSGATTRGEIAGGQLHEAFSTARLAELRAAGTPVFVDFTADWCLVCKVNERMAINTDATQQAFAEAGVVTLTGDWTRQDPEITAYLADHGRNSIPFYQFYAPGEAADVLPQVLTQQILVGNAEQVGEATPVP